MLEVQYRTPFILELYHSILIQTHFVGKIVYIGAPVDPELFQITIVSTIFHKNFMLVDNHLRKYDSSVLYLVCIKNLTTVNSTFSDSNCTSLATKNPILYLQQTVGFCRNTGYSGGALAFHHDAHCESRWSVRIENSMIVNPTAVCTLLTIQQCGMVVVYKLMMSVPWVTTLSFNLEASTKNRSILQF